MRIHQILLEYNRQITINRLGDKIFQKYHEDQTLIQQTQKLDNKEEIIDFIVRVFEINFDPTPNKMYVQWIIREWLKTSFRAEDSHRVKEVIAWFNDNKVLLKNNNISIDINKHSFHQLQDITDKFIGQEAPLSGKHLKRQLSSQIREESEILYDGPEGLLVSPRTEAASCFWGKGTKWCTAATTSTNYFDRYNKMSPLYIWINSKDEKYQFQFGRSPQFNDSRDMAISKELIEEFRTGNSVTSKLFDREEQKLLELESLYQAVIYTKAFIKGRWPKLEENLLAIKSTNRLVESLDALVDYTKFVIKDRWPEAEPLLLLTEYTAINYIMSCIVQKATSRFAYSEKSALRYIRKNPEAMKIYKMGKKLRPPLYRVTEQGLTDLDYGQTLSETEVEYHLHINGHDEEAEDAPFIYEPINN